MKYTEDIYVLLNKAIATLSLSALDVKQNVIKVIRQKPALGNVWSNVCARVANTTSVATGDLRAVMRVCFSCDVTVVSEVARCRKDVCVEQTSCSRWSK